MTLPTPRDDVAAIFDALGAPAPQGDAPVFSPIDGSRVAGCDGSAPEDAAQRAAEARAAFASWRETPAPARGEFVRKLGEAFRQYKEPLGRLVTLDCGKPISEGLGEVQEMIDICDFAVGLSRQLYGATMGSERPEHRLTETWHPLGPVAVISAFNFPVAVWSWNAAIAFVCGDPVIWKPSEKTPLTALAVHALTQRVIEDDPYAPDGLAGLLLGDSEAGAALIEAPEIALISATGSTRMGREVGAQAAAQFKRALLELGGNNAMIVAPSADRDLALRAALFAAFGASGQRCTSLRRLIVHRSLHDEMVARLRAASETIAIGDPRDRAHLLGPLIDEDAAEAMRAALDEAAALGWSVSGGERLGDRDGVYVRPAIVEAGAQAGPMLRETFAPIVYCLPYDEFDEAIALQNGVGAGLSAALFTNDLREEHRFLSAAGADCGICNVNVGTSGAEIGGAFGGEKETGGGREAGSDAWKAYMRRATQTVNFGEGLPLAQGVVFDAV